MAKKNRMGVLKRQREAKKAEKAAHRRAERDEKKHTTEDEGPSGGQVATQDDLAGYGFPSDEPETREDDAPN